MVEDRPGDDPTRHSLDFGVQRLKDIAFERAIEGQLLPVFVAGKLMGFRRKRNDHLLMFCLRHYGQDASGKRITINYFSTRASAGAAAGEGTGGAGAVAHASATTLVAQRSVAESDAARDDELAATLNGFEGVELDAEAQGAIAAALEACAARQREADAVVDAGGDGAAGVLADDPGESFVRLPFEGDPYLGELIPPVEMADYVPFREGEADWRLAGAEMPVAEVKGRRGRRVVSARVEPAAKD